MKLHKLTPLMVYMLSDRFSSELLDKGVGQMNQWQQDVYNGLFSYVQMYYWVQHFDLERAAHHAEIVDECLPAMREYVESIELCQ